MIKSLILFAVLSNFVTALLIPINVGKRIHNRLSFNTRSVHTEVQNNQGKGIFVMYSSARDLLASDSAFAKVLGSDTVEIALKKMSAIGKMAVAVVDNNDKLVGIFTQNDYDTRVLQMRRIPATTAISEVMTVRTKLITGSTTMSLNDCENLMRVNNVLHLPIVSETDTVLGLTSYSDIRNFQYSSSRQQIPKTFSVGSKYTTFARDLLASDSAFAKVLGSDTVEIALKKMSAIGKMAVAVVDNNDKLVGIFTQNDYDTRVLQMRRIPATTAISEVMTVRTKLITGSTTMSLNDCENLMRVNNVLHLPIVSETDTVLGLTSYSDIRNFQYSTVQPSYIDVEVEAGDEDEEEESESFSDDDAKVITVPILNVNDGSNMPSLSGAVAITKASTLGELLATGVGTVYAKANINDNVVTTVQRMNDLNRGSALIYNNDDTIAGIFTEKDFISRILEEEKVSAETYMKDVITPAEKLILGNPKMTIEESQKIMSERNIRHLPILTDKKEVLGVLSTSEIIRALQADEQRRQSAKLFGDTLAQVESQLKTQSNLDAFELSNQDILRSLFVVSGTIVGIALYQGEWIHNHEVISMLGTFILGYLGIVFENFFEFNKAAVALLMGVALWVIFAGTAGATGVALTSALGDLSEKVSEVSEVVYFLLGAMTIVEIVDAHQGFQVVTNIINSRSKRGLLWLIGIITFFMSAVLDNLTTTIVMVSLVKKILPNVDDKKLFGAMIVVAANAGGAWTPIGDVTTTMLWINGQISAIPTITGLFIPSLVSVIVSLLMLQSSIPEDELVPERDISSTRLAPRGKLVFGVGVAGLLSVPLFKAVTGLPPYLGMLSVLGVMWTLTDAIHAGEDGDERLKAPAALRKIDTSGVLFFLGILLSIGALDSAGILQNLAVYLNDNIPNQSLIAAAIGFASAIIDNVPLVAATMGMYSINDVPMDSQLWQLIAFCAGTGGSLLVIGSAAGVVSYT